MPNNRSIRPSAQLKMWILPKTPRKMARNLNHLCSASRHPVRVAGLEPARGRPRGILSPLRLPIPPYPRI